jgi:hypothetical protein
MDVGKVHTSLSGQYIPYLGILDIFPDYWLDITILFSNVGTCRVM